MTNWIRTSPVILKNDLAALLLGIILTFAFAPYEIFPLAVISLAGLLYLWLNVSAGRAFWLGYIFGMGLFGRGVYWIYNSIHDIGEVPIFLSFCITLIMVAFLSLYPALVGYFLNRYFKDERSKIIFAFPALWVASEWIRSWLFTGFPWLFLGYSQTNSPLRGYAPILGVYGVSLAVILSSALLINAYRHYVEKKRRSLYWNFITILFIWILGFLFSLIPWTEPQGKTIPVSLVQGNIPQTIKWDPEHLQLSIDRYQDLTKPLWGKDKLIIWPESAIPFPLQNATELIDSLDQKAIETGSNLILGIPIGAKNNGEYFNAIITLGKTKSIYLKRHLVPFGEYTPYSRFFAGALRFMDVPMSNIVPGDFTQKPLEIDHTQILSSICYEIAFPDLMRSRNKSIGFLLTLTNDAWFGESNAQAQHIQMAQMRALEFNRPLLFVSNDGITAIIGADGRIEAAAPPRQVFVLNGTIQPVSGLTPWMTNGSEPILVILICFILLSIRANIIKRQLSQKKTF